jgi:hypothetical protein
MKIFWSWQSDTPGKIGRHFVRDALSEAIEVLKQPNEIEEPSERETREAIELDHDRKGVPGSPDLAQTIFRKIEEAAVFVADVTLVGETKMADGKRGAAKKLINPNVAIEYGYALSAITDERILLVQNRNFGEREDLPFDLKHKAGPIQFTLAPEASAAQIDAERARLKGALVVALRPYLQLQAAPKAAFEEQDTTTNQAVFFAPEEVLARVGVKGVDEIEYTFAEPRAFYLRLIPTTALRERLKYSDLSELVRQRRLDALLRERYVTVGDRNRFGAITYEPHGTSSTPRAFSQAFPSGELWAVTTEFFIRHDGALVIPTVNVESICGRVLENFCSVEADVFGVAPPYQIELGAIGLAGAVLGINRYGVSEPIYDDQIKFRRVLNDASAGARQNLISGFLDALFDLAGEDRREHVR